MIEQMPVWFNQGECSNLGIEGVEIMNPLPDDERAEAIAKSICADCVFIEPCKEWGMKHNDVGVFGGLTQQERLTIKRKVGRERRRHNGMQGSRQ